MRRRSWAVAAMDGMGAGTKDNPIAGIEYPSDEAAELLQSDGGLHTHVHLAHSSQRFALDLFGSLDSGGVQAVLTLQFRADRFGQPARIRMDRRTRHVARVDIESAVSDPGRRVPRW